MEWFFQALFFGAVGFVFLLGPLAEGRTPWEISAFFLAAVAMAGLLVVMAMIAACAKKLERCPSPA